MSDQHPVDIWQRGYVIGAMLAKDGVDQRALYGGELKQGRGGTCKYYPMNQVLPLYAINGVDASQYDELLDGVMEGFENG